MERLEYIFRKIQRVIYTVNNILIREQVDVYIDNVRVKYGKKSKRIET
jgi:hypothetical protein